jgi:MFS family permease
MTFYGTASPPAGSRQDRGGRLALAVLAGLAAAVIGAVAWGLVAYLTKHQFSLVAVVIGVAVGGAVGKFRAGDPVAAAASAILALLGCALGAFLALVFTTLGAGIGLATILGHLNVLLNAYPHTVGILGVVFWLVAAYLGFRTALGGVRVPQSRRAGHHPGSPDQPPGPGQPAAPQPGQAGSPRPFFGPPADGGTGPSPADGPGFALPKDQAAGPREDR